MNFGKYIIVVERGHEVPILFHPLISHGSFLECYHRDYIRSAGFFETHEGMVVAFGASDTLGIPARSQDKLIISKFLHS